MVGAGISGRGARFFSRQINRLARSLPSQLIALAAAVAILIGAAMSPVRSPHVSQALAELTLTTTHQTTNTQQGDH